MRQNVFYLATESELELSVLPSSLMAVEPLVTVNVDSAFGWAALRNTEADVLVSG